MKAHELLQGDQGSVSAEYVIFVAAIGMLLVVGVGVLFNALGTFFTSWAGYFGAGG